MMVSSLFFMLMQMQMDLATRHETPRCAQPAGFVSNNQDCDDANPDVNPMQQKFAMASMTIAISRLMKGESDLLC
jgi:hypothetical protein